MMNFKTEGVPRACGHVKFFESNAGHNLEIIGRFRIVNKRYPGR
jgi:hypothetical protein